MKRLTLVLVFACFAWGAFADEQGDDTLRYYIGKSEIVIRAQVTDVSVIAGDEIGVSRYNMELKVLDVLQGTKPKEESLRVSLVRLESQNDTGLKQGATHIFFLKGSGTKFEKRLVWIGADAWFSVQPDNGLMAQRLKSLQPSDETKETNGRRNQPSDRKR
jgi:hypothetical protein